MSIQKEIKEIRADDALSVLSRGSCPVFFTLTTPDIVDAQEIRHRWRCLRNWMIRKLGNPQYIMNYEIHPQGHGWHIHAVFDCFIPLSQFLPKIHSFGFGRVDVRRVTTLDIARYLTKHCLKAYRGIKIKQSIISRGFRLRLINTSRGLPSLTSYSIKSEFRDTVLDIFSQMNNRPLFRLPVARAICPRWPLPQPLELPVNQYTPFFGNTAFSLSFDPWSVVIARRSPEQISRLRNYAEIFAMLGAKSAENGFVLLRRLLG